MIRFIIPDDTSAVRALIAAVELFTPEESDSINDLLGQYLAAPSERGEFWITDDATQSLAGIAYCAPERMTNGTWNVLLLAVHPAHQRHGHGTALMHAVERILTTRGERLLLVETAAAFADARAFYRTCGYEEEACIRDYYDAGQDKIVFRKVLAAGGPGGHAPRTVAHPEE